MASNAPEAAVPPEDQRTPPAEQTAPPTENQAPDQLQAAPSVPSVAPITPAEFTKRSQEMAAVRRELGLPPSARGDDILAAIGTLRAKASGQVAEDEIVDPKIAQRLAYADKLIRDSLTKVHGDSAVRALEFADFARRTRDPEEIVEKFYELIPAEPATAAATAPPPPSGPPAVPASMGLMDSDARPSGTTSEAAASEEFRNTGLVADFLHRANILRRREV